jgi:hypothetical protein
MKSLAAGGLFPQAAIMSLVGHRGGMEAVEGQKNTKIQAIQSLRPNPAKPSRSASELLETVRFA